MNIPFIMQSALAGHVPLHVERTHFNDLPRAVVDATAKLFIGPVLVAEIAGKVTVCREDGKLTFDEYEIVGNLDSPRGRETTIGCGRKSHALSYRDITDDEALEHLCAGAFMNLKNDASFMAGAEEELAEAEREWRPA